MMMKVQQRQLDQQREARPPEINTSLNRSRKWKVTRKVSNVQLGRPLAPLACMTVGLFIGLLPKKWSTF